MDDKIYPICVDTKDNFIEKIVGQIDDIRFKENQKCPTIELIFENINLNAKEFYSLFDELVIHQNVVISKIKNIKKDDVVSSFVNNEDIIFIGNINKENTIICNQNIKVMGLVEGSIIINDDTKSAFAYEFKDANVLINKQMYHIDHEKNYTVKNNK